MMPPFRLTIVVLAVLAVSAHLFLGSPPTQRDEPQSSGAILPANTQAVAEPTMQINGTDISGSGATCIWIAGKLSKVMSYSSGVFTSRLWNPPHTHTRIYDQVNGRRPTAPTLTLMKC